MAYETERMYHQFSDRLWRFDTATKRLTNKRLKDNWKYSNIVWREDIFVGSGSDYIEVDRDGMLKFLIFWSLNPFGPCFSPNNHDIP